MANFAWGAAILDLVLAALFVFLLIRIATSSDEYFRRPFYTFFVATGMYNIISVVSYIPMSHFVSSLDKRIYSASYGFNTFGAAGSTVGKSIITIHRYFVIKSPDLVENNWSTPIVNLLLFIQFAFSVIPATPIFLRILEVEAPTYGYDFVHTYLSKLISKSFAVVMYISYIICNVVFTLLSSRELNRLPSSVAKKAQSSMFIITSACSLSHLIKALYQFTIVITGIFYFDELYKWLFKIYPLVNGLSTYTAPVCLIYFSAKVRERMCFKCSRATVDVYNG